MSKEYPSTTVAPLWKRENDNGEYFTSVAIDQEMKDIVAAAGEGASFVIRQVREESRKSDKSPTHYLDIRKAKAAQKSELPF